MAENAVAIGNQPYVATGITTADTNARWDFFFCRKDFGIDVRTTGTPASFSVQVQGSLDGTNWYNLGSAVTTVGYTSVTSSPTRYLRVGAITLTGGTSPTASVAVGAI